MVLDLDHKSSLTPSFHLQGNNMLHPLYRTLHPALFHTNNNNNTYVFRRWQRILDVPGLADDAALQRERHLDPIQAVHRGFSPPA